MSHFDWNWIQDDPYQMLIDGQLTQGSATETFDVINPATNEAIASVWNGSAADADQAVAAARQAFDHGPWPHLSGKERGEYLFRVADMIRAEQEKFAFYEAADVGKTLARTLEYAVPQAIDGFEYHAGKARDIGGEVRAVPQSGYFNYRVWEPMGVVAEIVPWNGPFMMTCQKVSAILAAGNTVIIKPSQDGCLSNLELAKLFLKAGFPPGVVNVVVGPSREVGGRLVEHPQVDMVSLTGGTETGRQVMRQAAGTVKKVALELGGKNPNIIFDDANVEEAVQWAIYGAFADQGQICVSGSRLLLQTGIYEAFLDLLVERVSKLKIGDTMDDDTELGPVITRKHEQSVLNYIEIGRQEGANLVLGGHKVTASPLHKGNYIEPTIFSEALPQMCICQEEIFGPVVTVTPFQAEDEVLKMANGLEYGLAAGIWTRDLDRAFRMSRRIHAGQVYINSYFSPALVDSPAEGHKQSGVGGAGVEKYMQEKTVFMRLN